MRRLITILLVFAAVHLCACTQPPAPTPPPSRLDAIPPDAVRMPPDQDPYPPQLHVSGWAQPIPLPGPVNTAGGEDSPFILPDGQTFYFFFTPDVRIPAEKQLGDGVTGIYQTTWLDSGWAEPQRVILQTPGKLALDGCPFAQGDTLWFCTAREGFTGLQVFTAHWLEGRWQDWQLAPDAFQGGELHLSSDGQELYYSADQPGGLGAIDLWMAQRQGDSWAAPVNLTALNSPEIDGWPFLSQDGQELWFTRYYQGSPAIFRSLRVNGQWSEPELILSQFAGEPTLDSAGNLYFCHHYFIDGQMIEADIYVAYRVK
ncbi:MAG: PD40 domain-containing protein [Anaerolineales bacterium]|nr:PD40 domain-containing protein [Anaerolineales bacterium]